MGLPNCAVKEFQTKNTMLGMTFKQTSGNAVPLGSSALSSREVALWDSVDPHHRALDVSQDPARSCTKCCLEYVDRGHNKKRAAEFGDVNHAQKHARHHQ